MKPEIRDRLKALPDAPGCYLFRNRRGRIIYVGKAISLRKRVRSYFRASTLARSASPKLRGLVKSIAEIDWIVTRNEAEALLTESRLIKDYRPRFNIVLRDDKRYLAIKAERGPGLPRFRTCRIVREDDAEYFGPFPSAEVVRGALDFTEKRYGIRKCAPLRPDAETYRHCLNDIIRFCSAPCVGTVSEEEYRRRFEEACAFLRGQRPAVLNELADRMRALADRGQFEKAAALRDTLRAVRELTAKRVALRKGPELRRREAREGLIQLGEVLSLERPPRRIEGFDVSNLFGTFAVASLVCSIDGRPSRRHYRRFRIRSVTGSDDPRMMAEAVTRCYRRRLEEQAPMPDLLLVDGGLLQLRAARAALDGLGRRDLPAAGLAKRFEELVVIEGPPIRLPPESPALQILQRLRDEAHRFALAYHQRLRNRLLRESVLDELPGIGPARKQRIFRRFGSLRALARADVDAIAALPGISRELAENISRVARGQFKL